MPVSEICILQIGDIHFGKFIRSPAQLDRKDEAVSDAIASRLSLQPAQEIVRKLQAIIDKENVDALAFMGDLTNVGCLSTYKKCCQFLYRSFVYGRAFEGRKQSVVFVPGNHDVNRKNAGRPDVYEKFQPLNDALKQCGFLGLAVKRNSVVLMNEKGARLGLHAINTCIGCGEYRYLPTEVREAIETRMRALIKDAEAADNAAEQLYHIVETLDTPAVEAAVVSEVCDSLDEDGSPDVAVVCAHHNLLPQVIPRVDIYTELMNSGMLRKSLLQCNKPVLYLHGHIHSDPIDIVRDPRNRRGCIVCVSAPELMNGFNVVRIAFNGDNIPLGCEIKAYGMSDSGRFDQTKVTVSFWQQSDHDPILSRDARTLLSKFTPDIEYASDLVSRTSQETGVASESLRDALQELHWLGSWHGSWHGR